MSENGGIEDDERPSAVIIPVTTPSSETTSAQAEDVAHPAEAAQLRRVRKPNRLVVLLGVLALVVAGAGVVAFVNWRDQQDQRNAEQELAAQDAAQRDVRSVLSGYRLPTSVDPYECGSFGFRCGSTELDQRAAIDAVADSLEARGLEVEHWECDAGRPPTDTACRAGVLLRGQFVGSVEAGRKDVAYRIFGQPTSVLVNVYDADQAVLERTTVPITSAQRRAAKLPATLDQAIRCTDAVDGGCEVYRGRVRVEDRDAFWAETGRELVRRGWPQVSGNCDPRQPDQQCTLDASRTKDGRRMTLQVVVSDGRALVSLKATEHVPA